MAENFPEMTVIILNILVLNVSIILILKLRKDIGILARMINKIAGDLPH